MAPLYQHYNKQKAIDYLDPSGYTILQYQGSMQKSYGSGMMNISDSTLGTGWGLTPTNPNGALILSNTVLSAGAKTITLFFKMNTNVILGAANPKIGLAVLDSSLQVASTVTAWYGASDYYGANYFRAMSMNSSTYGVPIVLKTNGQYSNSSTSSTVSTYNSPYDFPQQTGDIYGVRIVDNGTSLEYYRSVNQGGTWTYICNSGPGGPANWNYSGTGLSGSPTRFGIYTISPTGKTFSASITSISVS